MLLLISAAQGPEECNLAVAKVWQAIVKEAEKLNVSLSLQESVEGREKDTYRSLLLSLDGENSQRLINAWEGTIQWICQSPYRPNHGRKNWFIGVQSFSAPDLDFDDEIRFEATRSGGPDGQHVNTTSSAIQATHIETGIMVRVETERSQHANRRLAKTLIAYKLEELKEDQLANQRADMRMAHHQVERGNPKRIFEGMRFRERRN